MIHEENSCDSCAEQLPHEPLELTVWENRESKPISYHFCSWRCVFDYLPTISSDYFVSLPYLHYDRDGYDGAEAFLLLIKQC